MRAHRLCRFPCLERLESRQVLAAGYVALDEGVLYVTGGNQSDRIVVSQQGDRVEVRLNGVGHSFQTGAVQRLWIETKGGDDKIAIAESVTIDARIDGGNGHDRIQGGSGDDEIFGGNGHDELRGGAGNDAVFGGGGNDRLVGEAGDDLLAGEGGGDLVRGGAGADSLQGGDGHDELFGDEGADWLQGDNGNDALRGGQGDDRLKGGAGRDDLNGNAGQNLLDGDEGRNTLKNGELVDFEAPPPPPAEFQPLFAGLDGGLTGGVGQAVYERQTSPGGLETFLHITVQGVPANATIDIAVNGTVIGQLHSDGDGFAEVKFSTIVDEPGELALPSNFNPTANDTISVGTGLSGVFTLA